jgi:antitoxin ParD1/3/4
MNVSLTSRLEKLVNQQVASGLYQSASEVIRAGLRLLQEQDELKRHRLMELRQEIALGVSEADQGLSRPLNMSSIRAQVRKRAPSRRKD